MNATELRQAAEPFAERLRGDFDSVEVMVQMPLSDIFGGVEEPLLCYRLEKDGYAEIAPMPPALLDDPAGLEAFRAWSIDKLARLIEASA